MKHRIAVLGSGIYKHPDLENKIKGFKDFVNSKTESYDDYGQGTFAAEFYAGSGKMNSKYTGKYPDAELVGLKVVDENGNMQSNILETATKWLIENKDELGINMACLVLPPSCQSIKELATKFTQEATKAGIEVLENPISNHFDDMLLTPDTLEYIKNGGKVDLLAPGRNVFYNKRKTIFK